MARLTTAKRKSLPKSDFAGPGRSYPVQDKAHARDAKAMAARFASPSVKAKVDAKADKVLGESKGSPKPKAVARAPRQGKGLLGV